MDSPSIDYILTRWAGVLSNLAKGPDGYGPHAVEAVCAALDKALTERDEALRQLGEERAKVARLTTAEPVADTGDCRTPPKRTCNRHDDCDAANAKAKLGGRFGADHCHDDCCPDCFG